MNDFTKEELQELLDLLVNGFGPGVKSLEIPKKIRFMIDNYCEHKDTFSLSGVDYVTVCRDCDKCMEFS